MSVTEEIKSRLDLVNFVSQYVSLRKAGRNYTACCPFHQEKTPSFFVFPESGTWRCFGSCAEGGDIFSFVMKREGLDFASALKLLADKANVVLQERTTNQLREDEHQEKLRGMMNEAAEFFHARLRSAPDAAPARAYMRKRSITPETAIAFKIGYSPDGWSALYDHLKTIGYSDTDMLDGGLVIRNDAGRVYDRFRNRFMIPICDGRGRVIGFGARALNPDDNPKYLNSPQTPLFDKSATLFGLHMARRTIRETETAVIVEGYMDAIQAHQAGFTNVVAQMGTALTEPQLKQLGQYARRLILALDADAAGVKATLRGLDVARQSSTATQFDAAHTMRQVGKFDIDMRVLTITEGKDPDDLIRQDPQAFRDLIENAQPIADFVIAVGTAHLKPDAPLADREHAARDLLPILLAAENNLQEQFNVQQLAIKLRLNERTLIQWAEQHRADRRTVNRRTPRGQNASAQSGFQNGSQGGSQNSALPAPPNIGKPGDTNTPSANTTSNTASSTPSSITEHQRIASAGEAAESYCLAVLLRNPGWLAWVNRKIREIGASAGGGREALGPFSPDDFTHSDRRAIFDTLQRALQQDDVDPDEYLEQHLPHDLRQEVERLKADLLDSLRQNPMWGRDLDAILSDQRRMLSMSRTDIDNTHYTLVKRVLELRRLRLMRENTEIYYMQQENAAEPAFARTIWTNRLALTALEKAMREVASKN
jgi:DNA primase